ncbi:MAG: PAS domain S-box protein [Gemmatimonadetes bacterium]|nr:PAS domain S-box protein [Gemmatimonadota bacterium]
MTVRAAPKSTGSLSLWARAGLALLAFAVYAAAYVPLYRVADTGASALVLIPVVITAWLLGSWGGVLAGLLGFPLNAALLLLTGERVAPLLLDLDSLEGPALVVVVGAVFGLLRDLGMQVQAQLERWRRATSDLQESQDRYRAVVEETSEGVVLIDTETKKIVEGNPAFRVMAAYGGDELRECRLYDLLSESRQEIDRGIAEIRSGKHFTGEKRLRRKDGSLGEVEVAVDLIVYGGREVLCCVVRDITERKRAAALLARYTEQLQEALAELEAITYSVSHDLRTPLLTIHGFGTHLLEGHAAQLDDEGRDFLNRMLSAADRMDALINDLLVYGRVGRAEPKLEPLDTGSVITKTIDQLEAVLSQRGAQVTVTKPLPRAVADAGVLGQVLENLLSNAIKFVPPDRTPHVRVRGEINGNRARIWVEDNGIGIAPEHRERIFRVFERLNPADAYSGTGVGLAIVQKGVERMGGKVGVESQPGKGSQFWIELAAAGE